MGLGVLAMSSKKTPAPTGEVPLINTELTSGLPPQLNRVNAYLYGAYYQNKTNNSNYLTAFYAAFSDPGKNLLMGFDHVSDLVQVNEPSWLGNIDMGNTSFVTYRDVVLNEQKSSSTIHYAHKYDNFGLAFKSNAAWRAEGNGTFKGFEQEVPRGFPFFKPINIDHLSKSQPLNFDVTAACNYDSLVVTICQEQGTVACCKRVGWNSVIRFSSQELSALGNSSTALININAFNYSYCIRDNKLMVFELSHKLLKSVAVLP
jgi:hypothetical protein